MTTATRPRSRPKGLTNPDTVANLVIWLKAADLALADGAAVASWTDAKSAKVFAQATGSKKPTYQATAFTGVPCVRFDGTDDVLSVASSLLAVASKTIFIAARSVHTVAATAGVFGWGSTVGHVGASAVGGLRISYRDTASTNVTSNAPGTSFNSLAPLIGTYRIEATATPGALVSSRKSGAPRASASNTPAPDAVSTTLTVGASNTASQFFDGDVAEVLAYAGALTMGEMLSVERYLADKYKVTVA